MAAWFLGLFLFIYTEKLLHTHKEADHINKTESHVSSCNTCALCDLQPGKDAELSSPPLTDVPSRLLPVQSERPASILFDRFFTRQGDRGPPAYC